MSYSLMLVDIGTIGVISAVVFFLAFAVSSYIAYRLLRKTLGMIARIAIVILFLFIAVIGSISLLYMGFGESSSRNRPVPSRSR